MKRKGKRGLVVWVHSRVFGIPRGWFVPHVLEVGLGPDRRGLSETGREFPT